MAGDGIDDHPALAWNLWWVKVRLVDQLNFTVSQRLDVSPRGPNPAFHTLTPLNGLLSIVLQVAFDLTVASNLLLLSSFVLGGLGVYLLVCQLLGAQKATFAFSVGASAAGGLYAFASAQLLCLLFASLILPAASGFPLRALPRAPG